MEVNHAALETAFVQQFELQADIWGKRTFTASHHDGRDEQVALVYQPGPERLGGEVGTAHADVRSIRVLALETVSSVLEYTILSAARHIRA